jgi:polysaccharide export outer membrane protein
VASAREADAGKTVWRAAAPADEPARGATSVSGWHRALRPDRPTPGSIQVAGFQGPSPQPEVVEGATSTSPLSVVPDLRVPMRGGAPPADDGPALPPPRPAGPVFLHHGGVPLAHAVPHFPDGPPGANAPHELHKVALPPYRIEPPDILLVEAFVPKEGAGPLKYEQPIRGQHLVGPDGRIHLGIYGSVYVGGMTLEEAREAIFNHLRAGRVKDIEITSLNVDVLAYNSKFYYVITDGGGYGEQIYPFLFTGSETVLDALAKINGLPPVSDKRRVWVARRGPGSAGQILPVDYIGISKDGGTVTNYQLMPGDRVYVKSDCWITGDTWLAKRLQPVQRILGTVLLGSETVNSIRNKTGTGGSTP